MIQLLGGQVGQEQQEKLFLGRHVKSRHNPAALSLVKAWSQPAFLSRVQHYNNLSTDTKLTSEY